MYRFFLAVLLTGLVGSSFASNILHKFQGMQKKYSPPKASKLSQRVKHDNYTDFSGSWDGTCLIEGVPQPEPISFEIENDDTSITIDGMEFPIGILSTEAIAEPEVAFFEHTTFTWSSDGSVLTLNDMAITKEYGDYSSDLIISLLKATWALKGDNLIVQGDLQESDGTTPNISITCTLSKDDE